MGLADFLGRIFAASNATPSDAPKLSGTSETALGSSVQRLPKGERGWITQAEAAHLFSNQDPQYAFGELDEPGKARLEQFASRYRCTPDFMPAEGRPLLEAEAGAFAPDDVRALVSAFEASLEALQLVDRSDPAVLMVARRLIAFAKEGNRDPIGLRDRVVKSFRNGPAGGH